ncbi:uncharacterized protein [Eurosta solidaginis]|uniref:uncharacterized protein n=1 Tax=Eurosta solidaginis TaxID=178769 RepID=UPI003530DF7C
MEENTKQKSKRRRVNPSHRWTESENMDLIEAVADATRGRPESFEFNICGSRLNLPNIAATSSTNFQFSCNIYQPWPGAMCRIFLYIFICDCLLRILCQLALTQRCCYMFQLNIAVQAGTVCCIHMYMCIIVDKPTAERFYTRIKSMASSLGQIEWMSLKCKMRYLKASYVSALDWKNKTGSGLLASGDESSVTAYIQKICPNFDMLADIFGQRKNTQNQNRTTSLSLSPEAKLVLLSLFVFKVVLI